METKTDAALIILGHGSTENPDSSAPTWDQAEDLLARGIFGEVHCAFWKEEPSFRQVLYGVDRSTIYVVPNFISVGYFTESVIPRELELSGPRTERNGRVINYCEPTGNHPRMTDLLLKRARDVAPDVDPAQTALFIVGHGTGLNENSAVAAKREVERIAALGIYGQVLNAYMEEDPLISKWDELTPLPNVVVVPFFISDGLHSFQDIPVLLGLESEPTAAASQRGGLRENPTHLRGRALYYASAIGTEPGFADLILDQVAAFDLQHTPPALP
jgi:sirohydrochlorin cobaltochelatase